MGKYFIAYTNGAITNCGNCPDDFDVESVPMSNGYVIREGIATTDKHYLNTDNEVIELTQEQIEIYNEIGKDRTTFDFSLMKYPQTLTDLEVLDKHKQIKWLELKTLRVEAETLPILFNRMVFDADLLSQQRISGAVQLAMLSPDTFTVNWTLANNSSCELSKEKLLQLGVAVATRSAAIFQYSQELRQQLDNANTIDEVNNVVWNYTYQ